MKELYSVMDEKYLRQMELYDSILKKCHHRILYNSRIERTYCFFQIPEFIIGVPIYNVIELRNYMMNSLKKNGFKLLYIEPNWLFIYWNKTGKKELTEKTKQIINSNNNNTNHNYKSIDTYKPSGNFIYDNSSMNQMKDTFSK